ncbi:MAG: FAD-binding protein [Sphingomonadales bacterium]|nr:FAD-binding protein [Sphingomonadales bacterium]
MKVDDPNWHSRIRAPLEVKDPEGVEWDDTADVVVVGLGGAGICAALEALRAGAKVIAIDRFSGGGATRMSGGVCYSGGGTPAQKEAGVEDSVEEMYRYLKLEVADAVADRTLRDFCNTSVENIEWLENYGVQFRGTLSPIKTSYPATGHFLYYSGNEAQADYADHAKPAPRGHRVVGDGLTGHRLFDPLLRSALALGLKLYSYSEARRFILSDTGQIVGIQIQHVDDNSKPASQLKKIVRKFSNASTLLFPSIAAKLLSEANLISDRDGTAKVIRIEKAVILAAGGYIHNRKMVEHYAPQYLGAVPLGSIGCDGSGIRLGQSVGAKTDRLNHVSAWRQFNPPAALASGIVVNGKGERFVSEDCYGGKIGHDIAEEHGGTAYIILDSRLRRRALWEAMPGKAELFRLQGAPALMGILMSSKKAATLEELAEKCGMDQTLLTASVGHYNRAADGLEEPQFRKHGDFVRPIVKPPFYAVDISIHNRKYLCPSISLGGIVVDEETGQALNESGKPIPRLFAAGKNAKGISSHRYVSGIALADCVYSGRIAGRSAAR